MTTGHMSSRAGWLLLKGRQTSDARYWSPSHGGMFPAESGSSPRKSALQTSVPQVHPGALAGAWLFQASEGVKKFVDLNLLQFRGRVQGRAWSTAAEPHGRHGLHKSQCAISKSLNT